MESEAGFRKYDHLERCEHPDVHDIGYGVVHVFPKIDGTNASVWCEPIHHADLGVVDSVVCCGSRTRKLSADADNAGFHKWVNSDDPRAIKLRTFVLTFPYLILYGEWLVPHTLRNYREEAWRRFYVFDVFSRVTGKYLPFDTYGPLLAEDIGIDVIKPLAIIENPSENQLAKLRDANTYLIDDGGGIGEGIVLKNYDWTNKHGRQPWAKMVRNEFKDANRGLFGHKVQQGESTTEADIVAAFVTPEFIRKEFAKVVLAVANDAGEQLLPETHDAFVAANRHKIIPRFLGTLYLTFIDEEMRAVVKKFRNPVVDFGKLSKLMTIAAKRVLTEVF